MVIERQVAGVNPYALAIRSGVSLTGSRLRGMRGIIDDITGVIHSVNAVNQQLQPYINGSSSVPGGVDIVPYQNAVVANVIAPVSAVVNRSDANTISIQDLQTMLDAFLAAKQAWLTFALNYPWPDARSRLRAEAGVQTLAPYWDDQEAKTRALMAGAPSSYIDAVTGGTSPAPIGTVNYPGGTPTTHPTGTTSTAGFSGVAALIGIGVVLLMSRK